MQFGCRGLIQLSLIVGLTGISLPVSALDYNTVGILDNSCDIGTGIVNQHLFNGVITVNFPKANRACKGTVNMTPNSGRFFSMKGLKGRANLSCSDGASIEASPIAEGMHQGRGRGVIHYADKTSSPFYFAFANQHINPKILLLNLLQQEKSSCVPSLKEQLKTN